MGQIKIKGVVIREPRYSGKEESKFLTEFEEMNIIGKGSFGCVVLCKNHVDDQIYVVKKIPIGAYDDYGYEKVRREALVLAGLCHDNVVRYFSAWVEPTIVGLKNELGKLVSVDEFKDKSGQSYPGLYIQQEYCESSLEKKLNGGLKEDECWTIFKQIVRGLKYIHENKVMHGDLSVANILIRDGTVKIADFGLARCIHGEDAEIKKEDREGLYCAPDEKVNPKADIYSAGLLLYVMLSRFTKEQERWHAIEDLKNTGKLPTSWTHHEHTDLLLRMLDKDPSNRPSASQLVVYLST